MKTLYINIDSTATSSNEHVEAMNYSLCDDFYFHIGEKIAGKYADETNLISLIADFKAPENSDAFAEIFNQWKEIKSILFGDNPHGEYEFILPKTYLTWLRYHTNEVYHKIYRSYFADKPTASITLNIEELYNDVVPLMDRELLYTIDKNENSKNFNWIVLADEAITKRIPLMYEMFERYKAHVITKTQWSKLVEKENHRNQKKNAWFCYETITQMEEYRELEWLLDRFKDWPIRWEFFDNIRILSKIAMESASSGYFNDFNAGCTSYYKQYLMCLNDDIELSLNRIYEVVLRLWKKVCNKYDLQIYDKDYDISFWKRELSLLSILDRFDSGEKAFNETLSREFGFDLALLNRKAILYKHDVHVAISFSDRIKEVINKALTNVKSLCLTNYYCDIP